MLLIAAFGVSGEAWAQSAVCSNTPDSNQRISCSKNSASTDDVDLDLDDVDISTTARNLSGIGVRVNHRGTGEIDVTFTDGSITTSGNAATGIELWQRKEGDVNLNVESSLITTKGEGDATHGIFGRSKNGIVNIKVRDSDVLTSGQQSHGIHTIKIRETGNMYIGVTGGSVTTSGNGAYAVYADHSGTGDIMINTEGSSISTSGGPEVVLFPGETYEENYHLPSHAIHAWHQKAGDIDIGITGGSVTASGTGAMGIYALHWNGGGDSTGNIDINVRGASITSTSASGIFSRHQGTGALNIDVRDGTVISSGSHGIVGWRSSTKTGDLSIGVAGSSVTASGDGAHGILARHDGSGSVTVEIQDAVVRATGRDANGVQIGRLDENGILRGSVGMDADGYRRQTVTVNSEVRGGSGNGAGIFLAGGGRVVIGPHGRVGADSGVAVKASGRDSADDTAGPRLHLDLALGGRPLRDVLGGGRIESDGGSIDLVVNGVPLTDGAGGTSGAWAASGAWDLRAIGDDPSAVQLEQAYAPRAALYESLPGLLLRLDAGAPVRRPQEPVWAQVGYGTGSGEADRSQTGATYNFDRIEALAGTSRAWGNFGGSVWLRHVQSEVKVDSPAGGSELELHGVGAGMAAHWRRSDGLEVSGELSLTDFDMDGTSSRHGRLARDVGAELLQARLVAGYRMEQVEGLTLYPRAWLWHAEADVDGFTDAVGARVDADESRTAAGLGLRAELARTEHTLYGSLDVERVIRGESTAIEVSGHRLASQSEKTRVWVGVGGRLWRGERVTLRGGLRLGDPGGRDQEVSASLSLGGRF